MTYFSFQYSSPVGSLRIIANDEYTVSLTMPTQKRKYDNAIEASEKHPVISKVCKWLDAYFRGDAPHISDLPLKPQGTVFQQIVWERLCRIPYGQTVTYGQIAAEIAAQLGKEKMSAQAVGQAVGANPIGIVIPCHRVMGADGKLTGYAGGIENKLWLLRHEGFRL